MTAALQTLRVRSRRRGTPDADGDGLGNSSDSQSLLHAAFGLREQQHGPVRRQHGLQLRRQHYKRCVLRSRRRGTPTLTATGLGTRATASPPARSLRVFVSNSTDLCATINTACNYDANSVTNAACQYNDVCGVCGGSGVPAGDCDCSGNQDDAIGVCGGTCTTDADSDGVCDDAGNDLCTNTSADNYTADPSVACTFSTPAITVTDTIMGCFDQVDAIALDLDTLHSGTGFMDLQHHANRSQVRMLLNR